MPAVIARRLGTVIMTRALSQSGFFSLDSYDRFFPNQDFLPSGGFGNLIALPLQYELRKNGKTVFVDDKLNPYENQWEYLYKVKRLSQDTIIKILDDISSLKEQLELSDSEDMDVNLAERDIDPLADELFLKIKVEEAFSVYYHKKANDYIGDGQHSINKNKNQIDKDDVSYLAIAFSRNIHAIISNDKIFKRQSETQVWKINDTDSLMTTYNEGFISICCLSTLPSIGRFIWDTISIAFLTFIDLITELIALAAYITQHVWEGMKKIPEEVSALAALFLIFSDTARDIVKQSGEFILKQVNELIDGVKKLIEYISSLLKEMYENCKPFGSVALQLISSMLLSVGIMYEEIQELEKLRVKG